MRIDFPEGSIILCDEDAQLFLEMLDKPPALNENFLKALELYHNSKGKKCE